MPVLHKKKRRRSERGNWLVVTYVNGKIWWCRWVQTWAGVQASKRNSEANWAGRDWMKPPPRVRVLVLDIERMVDFAVTEGANEIRDLFELWDKE